MTGGEEESNRDASFPSQADTVDWVSFLLSIPSGKNDPAPSLREAMEMHRSQISNGKYRSFLEELQRIGRVTELERALQKRVEKHYSEEIIDFTENSFPFRKIFERYRRVGRLFLGKRPTPEAKNREFLILQRQTLHDLQAELDEIVAKDPTPAQRRTLFERHLRLGILWRLFRKGVLKRKRYPAGYEISGQDADDSRLIFNLDPVEICYYGKRLVRVEEPQMLGEGALWEVPRSCAIRVPAGEDAPETQASVCFTLSCTKLKRGDPDLWQFLLQESFMAFLAKLDRSNERIHALVQEMHRKKISWERLIEREVETPVGETLRQTLERSALLHPSTSDFSRNVFLGYLEQIMTGVTFLPQATIIPFGAVPSSLFVLHRGVAAIRDEEGNIVGYLQPGDLFGESMLVDRPAIAEVVALERVEAIAFARNAVFASPALPDFFMNCVQVLQDKLAASNYRAERFEELLKDPRRVKALRARYPTDSDGLLRTLARWRRPTSIPPVSLASPDP
ncbi:MAG: hypothetical protein D6812_09455 [Deltaproteobacteria bacterium]|nr:MAG: hypothetical protein D6812_09455 [Deltaproteobacteria bacterium]